MSVVGVDSWAKRAARVLVFERLLPLFHRRNSQAGDDLLGDGEEFRARGVLFDDGVQLVNVLHVVVLKSSLELLGVLDVFDDLFIVIELVLCWYSIGKSFFARFGFSRNHTRSFGECRAVAFHCGLVVDDCSRSLP